MFSQFMLALGITAPIFIVLVFGMVLRRRRWIDDSFVETGSSLVFRLALPCVLFLSISQTRFEDAFDPRMIAVGVGGTFLVWLLLEWVAGRWIQPPRDRGVVIQASFRANMGIIGLAYCVNAYGTEGLAQASIYLALVTILYNVLSVVTLNRWVDGARGLRGTVSGIVKNPLIIAIVSALPFSITQVSLPAVLIQSGAYLAQLALPLALLCTGASLSFAGLRADSWNAVFACFAKLFWVPVLIGALGVMAGLSEQLLGIVILMASAPTAAASYVMVRGVGGNATLAANIIVLTTLASAVSTSVLLVLAQLGGFL
ncbi:AEC family transporter [Litorivicinus lipolyticus]|nr:AEC family transporter [Litorivicinus lipolyticus]